MKTLLLLLLFSPAIALADCASEFRDAAKQIPATLLLQGKTRVGRLDLKKFIALVDTVKVKPISGKLLQDTNAKGRSTGRWEVRGKQKAIGVDCAWWNKYPEQKSVFALHEYFGALRFYDDIYSLSTSLWLMTQPDFGEYLRTSERNKIENWAAKNANVQLASGGGVVGIGGGGETVDLQARTQLIRIYVNKMKESRSEREREEFWKKAFRQLNTTSSWYGRFL